MKKPYLIIFFIFNLILCIFFTNKLYANAASRAIPILSLVFDQTFVIDKYHKYTIDKSYINGHYYTDKAPLSTFATLFPASLLISKDKTDQSNLNIIKNVGAFFCSTLPFLFLLFLFIYTASNKFSQNTKNMALVSMLLYYSSNLFPYVNELWGHILASALLISSLYFLLEKENFFSAGLLLGLSISAEYTLVVVAIIWFILMLIRKIQLNNILTWCSGLLIPVSLLMVYHYVFTGNPFTPLYFYVDTLEFKEMRTLLGFNFPSIIVLGKLLFSFQRSIFLYTPTLLLLLYFISKNIKMMKYTPTVIFTLSASIALIVLNSSYFMWFGGWCHGPRHLIPIITLVFYFTSILLRDNKLSLPLKYLIPLSLFGIFNNIIVKSVGTTYSQNIKNPLLELLYPRFIEFKFDMSNFSITAHEQFVTFFPFLWGLLFLAIIVFILKLKE